MGLTNVFQISLCIVWIHNESMYVRFGGIRNTKTWSKSKSYRLSDLKTSTCICHGRKFNLVEFQILPVESPIGDPI